jgi:hypothetical protein
LGCYSGAMFELVLELLSNPFLHSIFILLISLIALCNCFLQVLGGPLGCLIRLRHPPAWKLENGLCCSICTLTFCMQQPFICYLRYDPLMLALDTSLTRVVNISKEMLLVCLWIEMYMPMLSC